MKNQLFSSRTTWTRRQKLHAVLKNCAGGALNVDEIDSIVNRISLYHQYTITLYSDPMSFAQAARLPKSDLPGPIRKNSPMAVVAKRDRDEDCEPDRECVIHIFIPSTGGPSDEQ